MAAPTHVIPDVEEDLAAAERLGLKLMLKTRTVFLLLMMGLIGGRRQLSNQHHRHVLIALFVASGIIQHTLVGTKHERWWHRYGFFSLDVLAIGVMVALILLSLGDADVPQILIFRT